jgi:hypothetical protein
MNPESIIDLRRFTPDEMRELYKKNPVQFDELAASAINQACICRSAKSTLRCRQIQWTIDAQLRKARTPLGRMQIMENIFYGGVFSENGKLADLMENCIELVRSACWTEKVPTEKPVLYLAKK